MLPTSHILLPLGELPCGSCIPPFPLEGRRPASFQEHAAGDNAPINPRP